MEKPIIELIKNNLNIPKNFLEYIEIKKDVNCFYRVLAKYFTNDENNHMIYRNIIYEAAKKNAIKILPFFISGEVDEIIVNKKFDSYIEEIKCNGFLVGNIEMAIACIIFNLNIVIYRKEYNNDQYYNHNANIWNDNNNENCTFLLILLLGNNHYSLLKHCNKESINNKQSTIVENLNIEFNKLQIDKEYLINNNKLCCIR